MTSNVKIYQPVSENLTLVTSQKIQKSLPPGLYQKRFQNPPAFHWGLKPAYPVWCQSCKFGLESAAKTKKEFQDLGENKFLSILGKKLNMDTTVERDPAWLTFWKQNGGKFLESWKINF